MLRKPGREQAEYTIITRAKRRQAGQRQAGAIGPKSLQETTLQSQTRGTSGREAVCNGKTGVLDWLKTGNRVTDLLDRLK